MSLFCSVRLLFRGNFCSPMLRHRFLSIYLPTPFFLPLMETFFPLHCSLAAISLRIPWAYGPVTPRWEKEVC